MKLVFAVLGFAAGVVYATAKPKKPTAMKPVSRLFSGNVVEFPRHRIAN
jgi:hypothetical protein